MKVKNKEITQYDPSNIIPENPATESSFDTCMNLIMNFCVMIQVCLNVNKRGSAEIVSSLSSRCSPSFWASNSGQTG